MYLVENYMIVYVWKIISNTRISDMRLLDVGSCEKWAETETLCVSKQDAVGKHETILEISRESKSCRIISVGQDL